MKYLLLIYLNPEIWGSLTAERQAEVRAGHQTFQKTITESGEMISTVALDGPSASAVVRVRAGEMTATDGPYVEAKEYLAGYYLVECADMNRARELAGLVPDAEVNAMEVRPVVFAAGLEG
ncbi:YCII-related domain protein [Actinoalloteichus hoggarensis]|uniref:YCII-related domain protein n=1 Tax=Actinoalloteichus hoggarensis TaxID=1470176 RepID=A0A221W5G1_9PSEU|nr:YciI family protein [Actinoalloteichus hoggarensis]ASO20936.1 YCII-related domain protein [Actinoalloteichus hoggarensis]